MKDYASMSDFEINKAVAIIEGHKCYYDNGSYTNGLDANRAVVKGNGIIGGFDPCNNPADAWPIVTENRISIKAVLYSQWMAEDYLEEISSLSQNPLRCAMIVFLMMKESEK